MKDRRQNGREDKQNTGFLNRNHQRNMAFLCRQKRTRNQNHLTKEIFVWMKGLIKYILKRGKTVNFLLADNFKMAGGSYLSRKK